MADIVLQDINEELSELAFSTSNHLRRNKNLRSIKPLLDRKVSHTIFIKSASIADSKNVLVSSNPRLRNTPYQADRKVTKSTSSLDIIYDNHILTSSIWYFQQDKRIPFTLFIEIDTEEVGNFFQTRQSKFFIILGLLPFLLFSLQSIFVRFLIQKPLINLHAYAKDQKSVLNNYRLTELNSLKDSLKTTFDNLSLEREKTKEQEKLLIFQSRHAAIGEMIAMIAHQWRQPLMAISAIVTNTKVEIALNKLDQEKLDQKSDDILRQTSYLTNTINDFSNFFKPNQDRQRSTIPKVVDNTLEIMGHLLKNNDIKVRKSYDTNTELSIFSNELQQVLINIIKNAYDVLQEKEIQNKEIEILVDENPDYISIKISDNAGGVEDAILFHIFDPYFSTKKKNGTGLGLYMSKTIIEDHFKGKLNCINIQNGAQFIIQIPRN
ncbi:MAG: ATP-binding protein [Thiovulaceae bacterium]|nr:ATP-binding protein [Sulfurimonadaceae bacterium]